MSIKKTTVFQVLCIALLVGAFSMCTPNAKKKTAADIKAENAKIEAQIRKVVYPLPSAKETTDMLNEIQATYMIGVPNDPLNAEKYALVSTQAINLGVYGTDLSYASTYRQQNSVTSYIKACQALIHNLDITSSFGTNILDRVENNLDNKEALSKEISDIFLYTYASLRNDKKPELASLILAGSWIEGMYLTTSISENTVQNPKILSTILYQEESFNLLMDNLTMYKDSPICNDIYTKLLDIDAIFKSNTEKGSITQKQLDQLTTTIETVRNSVVKLK